MNGGEIMKYFIVCIFLILFISGCQTTSYKHPTKEAQDLERDKYQCEKIAKRLAADAGSPENPIIISKETKRCLKLKFGWTSVES
jgi:hypothetical protein